MDAKSLIETLRARGVDLRVDGGGIQAEAPQEPDSHTKALLDALRDHREEVKAIVTGPPCWDCETQTIEVVDIYGRRWWKCWACAVTV